MKSATRRQHRKSQPASDGLASADLQFWALFVALLLGVGGSALGVVYTTHWNRFLLNELQQLEETRNELKDENRELLLEQSSLVSQGRLEEVAMSRLDMREPALESLVIVTEK